MGRNNNPTRGSTIRHVVRTIAASVAAAATLAAGMLVAGTANAAIQNGNPGLWTNLGTITFSNGNKYENMEQSLGVVDRVNGRNTYCIQADVLYTGTTGTWGEWTDENSRPDAQRLAWLTDKYNGNKDDLTQAAIAGLIHRELDPIGPEYLQNVQRLGWKDGTSWDTYTKKMNELWNEAVANTPSNLDMRYQYTIGQRKGTIDVGIQNGNGGFLSGITYTATLKGPAVFDQTGKNTISGTTTNSAQHVAWTATGNGKVMPVFNYKVPKAAKLSSPNQNLMAATDPGTQTNNITFEVRSNFQPTVSTQVSDKIVPRGARVSDKVTSGIKKGDEWIDGANVTAKGYYYTLDARQANDLTVLKQDKNEKTADYLNRVAKTYGNPVATADATFDRNGQERTVTAKNANGTDYVNPQDGRVGTWVWVILKNEQTQPDYITADYVDPFGQITESDVHKAAPNHDSTVLEQYTGLNKDIMDTITIGGLPQDYGQFNTNKAYGFGADVKAKIRVWWAGSGTGDRTQDEKFKPTTQAEPTADANHRLLGEWEVPAGNGTYKVGGGSITFRQNNTGDEKTVATGVNIKATTNNESGYYVFVYDFPGSDRAEAFKSDYNDPWERSFVEVSPTTATLTSDVSKPTVMRNERFFDTAHITGTVPRGSYVTFTAYDAVSGSPDMNVNKLLDNERVNITDAQADAGKPFDVRSPDISTPNLGNVYWQARLYNNLGQELASHMLGIENETTTVLGNDVKTKTSSAAVYPGQKFHDTATITGKLDQGAYVTFDAYGPAAVYRDGLPKILDNARVNIPADKIANSQWNTGLDVDSPEITASGEGNIYWVATVHAADGSVLATHEPGIAGETVQLLKQSITTHVSSLSVGLGEEFTDSADINGIVQEGDYVVFRAYNPVGGDPDTNAGLLLKDSRVVLDADQAAASVSGTVTVKSPAVASDKPGKVYWQAELHAKDGALLATHDLGLPEETVTVTPPTITTHVSSLSVGLGEKFSDKATVTGKVLEGSRVKFTAYNPVDLDPDTNSGILYTETVNVTAEQAKASSTTPFTVASKKTSTMKVGNVYWLAQVLDPDGTVIAQHDLGLPEETVRVTPPKITTQVTRPTVKPGEEFADKATISGKVERGSYVTFDAYEPVSGDPDTTVGKLVDNAKVPISDKDADTSAKKDVTVTSPKTKTDDAGAVYWKATLYAPDGTVLNTHDLGLPSETTFVQPGGIVTSNAQKLGATGEQLYDEITVYDETSAEESADGQVHEGKSNSNPHGVIGRIPQHSTVTVEMYRQSTEDNGDQGMYKIAEKTVTLDTNQMTPIKEGQSGNRPGKLTLKVTDPKFKTDKAGMVYWKTTLKTSNGAVLDSHIYGEWNSDHESGYKSYERTPVQKYSTTVSKKWLSDADGKYADSTLQVYDVLHQTGYEPYNDEYRVGNTAQTPAGATMQFEIWSKDGKNKGTMVKSYDATELPGLNRLGTGKEPDPAHPNAGDDTLDNYQNVKSATATIPSDWDASKYYYRVRITVPTTTPGTGSDERDPNRDVVWYGGYDEDEAFDVIHVDTTTTEPLWVDGMNVSDEITLKGNIPAGMQYEAELWRTSKDGNVRKNAATKYDDTDHKGVASEKVATTGRQDVPKSALGAHLEGVTFRTKSMESPGVGSYIWRVKLYSPEQPHDTKNGTGTGGDTSMPAQSGVITGAWMKQAGAAEYADDPQGGDHWSQANEKQTGVGDGYRDRWLLFDGRDVDSEKFEVIRIDTDVAGTNLIHTWKNEHYVDVTNNGADVNDHATISGYMLDGYKLGFELYKQASGTDAAKDTKVNGVDPVSLQEAQKELDSAKLHITDPGDYYWVTVFTKPDGTAWQPDNVKESRSDKRVKAESFHAVRITTTTAKWTGKDNTTTDVALIEGCLPEDAIANFELHDYETGDKVAETGDTTLKELGYKTCSDGNTSQSVESKPVTLPDAKDHYFVESVRFPNEDKDQGFHRGNDKVKSESTRTITANTDVNVETMLNIPVSDHTDLVNVKYLKNDGKDIRDDLTGPLTASWEVWKQDKDDDPSKDVKITTLADGKQAIQLESGQTEAYSPEWTPSQTGIFYFRVIIKDENGKVLKYGAAREPSETIRIIDAKSKTTPVVDEQDSVPDKVTITGPVAAGTMVSWQVKHISDGGADYDEVMQSWNTPKEGAVIITDEQAKEALENGGITVESPRRFQGKAGEDYYFEFSLTSPKRAEDGTPAKAVKDKDGVYTTEHLESNGVLPIGEEKVDGDETEPQTTPTPFYTDRSRVDDETMRFIKIATTANTHNATVGDKIHDTAHITGHVTEGYCVKFEYWQQNDGDAGNDKLLTTTDCVTVPAGATSVDSPEITADKEGTFYWREQLIPVKPEQSTGPVTYGKPRVADETVRVHPLAKTGIGVLPLIGGIVILMGVGLVLTLGGRRRTNRGRHMA